MKSFHAYGLICLTSLCLVSGGAQFALAESGADPAELVRSTYRSDRKAFLAEMLPMTAEENAAFWPLYQAYRTDIDALGDKLIKLVLEYADAYPNLSDERAEQLLKEYASLEQQLVKKRAYHYKRVNKVLPAAKVLRWAQLENRMDLALRLQLAGSIPLAPEPQPKR